ncbi:MAG TPA: CDP-alcohol phosphatidyltransferase family protein [Dongiaceae bacterium]|nr:CDP-alcohol phosphatidyltransferase family protein [Dongiaceae bacterium]
MLDPALRRLIDPPLDLAGRRLAALGVGADGVTLAGFCVGMAALPLLAADRYGAALAAILLNRLADGLDGAIARARGPTELGGYLDILCDFLFYAGVVFGFALAAPANRLAGAFLLFSFIGTGSSFLAFAVLAARRGWTTELRGRKSFYHLGGLTEGSETIAAFAAMCLFPDAFPALAWIFGAACWLTTLGRAWTAWRSVRP